MATRPQPRYKKGDKIDGRYQIHDIKMGGMGEVYLCLDLEQMYPFALKTFQQRYQSQALRKAFEKEVSAWVALEKHPNIVRCFYMDILDNQPFMRLEWIAGEEGKGSDLRSWLQHGSLDLQLALDITIDICRGLVHTQEKQPGLVHRDLKPENILIAQGRLAKITDFGLAEIVQEVGLELDATAVETGGRQGIVGQKRIVGTPAYMAPEQWRGESLDERTDIYAVGCIVYEMLVGELPFKANLISQLRELHLSAPVPRLPDSMPNTISTIISRCLEKNLKNRFSNSSVLLSEVMSVYSAQFGQSPRKLGMVGQFTSRDYNNRGVTYEYLGLLDKALMDYNQAIKLSPRFSDPYTNRGGNYQAQKKYQKALSDYTRAIELDPTDPRNHSNRGVIYQELNELDKALADYTCAIELDPNFVDTYYNRAIFYSKLGRYQEAVADYAHVINLDPTSIDAYSNRGNLYLRLGQPDKAVTDQKKAVELDPTNGFANLNLGVALAETGDFQAALQYGEKAVELNVTQARAFVARLKQKVVLPQSPMMNSLMIAAQELYQTQSVDDVRRVAKKYPFLLETNFILIVEQFVASQTPPTLRLELQQRLAWLRQIADEQQ